MHKRLPVILTALVAVLTVPSLWTGWIADDYLLRIKLLGASSLPEISGSVMNLFTFADGDPERNAQLMDRGLWPWWTYKGIKAAFLRPLAGVTHWLDCRLWPDTPMLCHGQSLLWLAGLVGAAALLYRRILGLTSAAGLAALLFAIEDAHGPPVGFLANRNALLAALFGVLAILVHDRWRRDGWRAGLLLGPALLMMSLLSSELGVSTLAYLAAHALCLDSAPWRRRIAALLPYGIVVVAWRMAYAYAGYGVCGVGLYIDPLTEPARYVAAAVARAPGLLLAQWAVPPAEVYFILSHALPASAFVLIWVGTVGCLVALALGLRPLLKSSAVARFWGVGMILALLPSCAIFPMDRLLLFVGIGAFGLMAQVLIGVFNRGSGTADGSVRRPRRFAVIGLGYLLLVVHVVLAPIALPFRARYPMGPTRFLEQTQVNVPMDRSVEQQTVVIVNSPIALATTYLPIRAALEGRPVPRHTRVLSPSSEEVTITRLDVRTLVIHAKNGYLATPADQLCRTPDYPLALGEKVELTGLTDEVTALTDDHRPTEARFRFSVPLEDPSLRWLQFKSGQFETFRPPEVGEQITVPRAPTPF